MWAIFRKSDCFFVTYPNNPEGKSYSAYLQHARIWETWEDASKHKCQNETIIDIALFLRNHIVPNNAR